MGGSVPEGPLTAEFKNMENPAILLRHLKPYCARTMEVAAIRVHAEIRLEQGEGDLHEQLRPSLAEDKSDE